MTEVLSLKKEEWMSLAATFLILVVAFWALQYYSPKPVSNTGKPRFDFTIGSGQLKNPLAVAYYKDIVAVTSSDEGAVKLFSPEGKLIKSIKIGKKSYPASLAFNENGTLYIGDLSTKAIFKINVLLNSRLEKLKLKTDVRPQAIGIVNSNVLVYDGISQELKLIDDSFKAVNFIKDKNFTLSYANGIYNDGNSLYISDSNGRRVLKFGISGNYQASLKNFSLPRGLAVDGKKRLHIVDTFAHSVKVFGVEGKFLFSYGSEGNSDDQFYFPNGLAIDSVKGKIYITDKGNNRLQVWSW